MCKLFILLYHYTDTITSNDHQEVYEKVFDARGNWRDLGGALGLDINTLGAIDIKYRGDVQDCLREMIAKRLQSGGPLSWKDLCVCLRKQSVGHRDVADKIKQELGKLNRT